MRRLLQFVFFPHQDETTGAAALACAACPLVADQAACKDVLQLLRYCLPCHTMAIFPDAVSGEANVPEAVKSGPKTWEKELSVICGRESAGITL